MSYDVIEHGGREKNDRKGGSYVGKIFLGIFIIILIGTGAFAAYYFLYKKKNKKENELLKDINDINLSMEDQSNRGINTEEDMVK